MATTKISSQDIRIYTMDKAELNTLLRGVRWSSEEIDSAIVMTISYYNESPPLIDSYSAETFPYRYALLMGVTGYLLKSAAINEASNNLTYNIDGVTVNDKDKSDIFLRMGQQYWEEYKGMVQNFKVTKNIGAAFGGVSSELQRMAR